MSTSIASLEFAPTIYKNFDEDMKAAMSLVKGETMQIMVLKRSCELSWEKLKKSVLEK